MKRLSVCAIALLAGGCLGGDNTSVRSTLVFDMNVHGQEWLFGGADFPAAQSGAVGIVGDLRALPAPFNTATNALYLKGTNVGGDLFMFGKKYFSGLDGNTSYDVTLETEFATAYDGGCTTGPGPVTFIKMGVTGTEPLASADQQGILRFNFDKGTGSSGGDFVSGGDIRNSNSGCPSPGTYNGRVTPLRNQTFTLTTDPNGGIWLWVGTQSSFVGEHEIFIIAMRLTIQPTS
jgi:hypothetical protein